MLVRGRVEFEAVENAVVFMLLVETAMGILRVALVDQRVRKEGRKGLSYCLNSTVGILIVAERTRQAREPKRKMGDFMVKEARGVSA